MTDLPNDSRETPQSLEGRVVKYFDDRPGEKIWPDDIAAAFDLSMDDAIELCERLEGAGSIRKAP